MGWLADEPRLRVGLTGGIASGKSLAAESFRGRGAAVLDADDAARAVTAPGSAGLAALVARLGPGVLGPDGALDRGALRRRAFADPSLLRTLEDELHPRILALLAEQARAAEGAYLVFVIPLLVERGMSGLFHRVVAIDCDERLQLARLQGRDGTDAETARRMLAAQASRDERRRSAHHVVLNEGTPAALDHAIGLLHGRFAELAAHPPFPPARREGDNSPP